MSKINVAEAELVFTISIHLFIWLIVLRWCQLNIARAPIFWDECQLRAENSIRVRTWCYNIQTYHLCYPAMSNLRKSVWALDTPLPLLNRLWILCFLRILSKIQFFFYTTYFVYSWTTPFISCTTWMDSWFGWFYF